MFKFLVIIAVSMALSACGKGKGALPENEDSLLGYCGPAPANYPGSGFANIDELRTFLSESKVVTVNSIPEILGIQLAFEMRRIPSKLEKYLVDGGTTYRVMQGRGVGQDPEFVRGLTHDGRPWAEVPGGANDKTTSVVVNRLYEGHGSINLVLHERAHTLDLFGLPKGQTISSSKEWSSIVRTDDNLQKLMRRVCGKYCTENSLESFAETFAIYHSCDRGRALLNGMPKVTGFMRKLEDKL